MVLKSMVNIRSFLTSFSCYGNINFLLFFQIYYGLWYLLNIKKVKINGIDISCYYHKKC